MKINRKFLSLIVSAACAASLFFGVQSVTAETDDETEIVTPEVTMETDITDLTEIDYTEETTQTAETIPDTTEITDVTEDVTEGVTETSVETTVNDSKAMSVTQTTTVTKKIEIDLSAIESEPQLQWYYSDEKEFYINGIKVLVDGNEVDTKDIITFNTTPVSTYDGKNFNYTVGFNVKYEGQVATGVLDVKIGQRGDANCDNVVNIRDAAAIANDLAQLYSSRVSQLTAEDGFGIFLANSDEGISFPYTDYYGKFKLNVIDASNLAYYIANKYKDSTLTLYNVLFV